MPNYDFSNLSPIEFEELSRDLLQKELSVRFESFTAGRDQGIDLRLSESREASLVVQCKRSKDFASLLGHLKAEKLKVKKLNPARYLLITSAGLTPQQKRTILDLFSPFIKSEGDIFGRNDINNLLGKFPEIERKHFKLWMSSTNILETVLKSKILNQTSFAGEEIEETIRTYAQNESFEQALSVLEHHNLVMITGIPGIGKTTLARMLVCHLLKSGFDEFILLSDSINEAYEMFHSEKKQVFLFDDFLGSNFLGRNLENNEDSRLEQFIRKIGRSTDKVLIFTTREYILSQAKQRYEFFSSPVLQSAKCVIELSNYSLEVRARILYNHLYFGGLSSQCIDKFVEEKRYDWVIRHPNYNPRLIESIIKRFQLGDMFPAELSDTFQKFLDNPDAIWRDVYENKISAVSQCLLANMMTVEPPISITDLGRIVSSFAERFSSKYGIGYSEIVLNKAVRELENTFLKVSSRDGTWEIDYQNPSFRDFLVNYIRELPGFVEDILLSAVFINQYYSVFSFGPADDDAADHKIRLSPRLYPVIEDRIIESFSRSEMWANTSFRRTDQLGVYSKLDLISLVFPAAAFPRLHALVLREVGSMLDPQPAKLSDLELEACIKLLERFGGNVDLNLDRTSVLRRLFPHLVWIADLQRLRDIFPAEFQSLVYDREFGEEKLRQLVDVEMEYLSDWKKEWLGDKLKALEFVEDVFEFDVRKERDRVYDVIWEAERLPLQDMPAFHPKYLALLSEQEVDNLFDSLRAP